MRTSAGFSNAVAPNMKLEQTIQRPKKVSGGIIGQTKQNAFVTEWELAYHEVLTISKSYSNITRSILVETDTTKLNKELWSKNMKKYYEAVKQVFDFFNERGNPYKKNGPAKLYHFILKQVVPSDKSDCNYQQKLLKNSWRAFSEKRKESYWHYKANHCATISAKKSESLNWK